MSKGKFNSAHFIFRPGTLAAAMQRMGVTEGLAMVREPAIELTGKNREHNRSHTMDSHTIHIRPEIKTPGAFGKAQAAA